MDMKIFNYNISPISNYELNKNNKTNKVQNNYSDGRFMLNSLRFLGDINRPLIKKSIDIPIKDDEEFNEVMNRVYSAKTLGGNELWIPEDYKNVFITYRNASDIEMGLIPYCGESDNSYLINVYLSGRLEDSDIKRIQGHHFPQNIDSCVDVVRALDYSLKNLDKEFGKYEGIVYRKGYMDEGNGQFYSTTKDASVIQDKCKDWTMFDSTEKYSVIRLKNGHKIYDFQEKMGSVFAEKEAEVLTSRNAKYRKLQPEELDEELLNAKEELARNLFYGADMIVSGEWNPPMFYNKEQLLSLVDVYDEI